MDSAGSDGPAAYTAKVRSALQKRGWELDRTRVSDDVYLLGGTHREHGSVGVVIVSAGKEIEMTENHLQLAAQAQDKYDADTAMVHCQGPIPDPVRRQAKNSSVELLENLSITGATSDNHESSPNRIARDTREQTSTEGDSSRTRRAILSLLLLSGLGGSGWLFLRNNKGVADSPKENRSSGQDSEQPDRPSNNENTENPDTRNDQELGETERLAEGIVALLPPDPDSINDFGCSVAVSDNGETVLVGDTADPSQNGDKAGAVYVFRNDGDQWHRRTKLTPENRPSFNTFGSALALTNNDETVLIGAKYNDTPSQAAGAVYVFNYTTEDWQQQEIIRANDANTGNNFGCAIDTTDDRDISIIGARGDKDPHGLDDRNIASGSAYAFEWTDNSWEQQAKITAEDGNGGERFGSAVAVSDDGTTAVIGAPLENLPDGTDAGAAYVFTRSGSTWQQQSKLIASDAKKTGDGFGGAVGISSDGNTVVVGAQNTPEDGYPRQDGTPKGTAYIFHRNGETWTQRQKLNRDQTYQFGEDVAMLDGGSTVLVAGRERVYEFTQTSPTWQKQSAQDLPSGGPVTLTVSDGGETGVFGADGQVATVFEI